MTWAIVAAVGWTVAAIQAAMFTLLLRRDDVRTNRDARAWGRIRYIGRTVTRIARRIGLKVRDPEQTVFEEEDWEQTRAEPEQEENRRRMSAPTPVDIKPIEPESSDGS